MYVLCSEVDDEFASNIGVAVYVCAGVVCADDD